MGNFSDKKIQEVWEKAKIEGEEQKDEWRKDVCGAWINRNKYGEESDFGWEVDHIKPVSKGGRDEISNLMPLHWSNNRTKGDDYPEFKSSVTSEKDKNIEKELGWNIT